MTNFSKEAFDKSRDIYTGRYDQPTELQIALGHFAADNFSKLPEPRSPEAFDLVARTKPERFAHLAHTISTLFEYTFNNEDSIFRLPRRLNESSDAWFYAKNHYIEGLEDEISNIKRTPEYIEADNISRLVAQLTPQRFISVETQLKAGSGTAIDTMLTSLKNLPQIAKHYTEEFDPKTLPQVAKQSSSIVFELMKRSVDSLMCARRAISYSGYWHEDTLIDPRHFTPVFRNNGLHSLQFRDLENINVPVRNKKLKDIKDDSTVVGCPLSILHGTYKELWIKTVDSVTEARLWEADPKLVAGLPR